MPHVRGFCAAQVAIWASRAWQKAEPGSGPRAEEARGEAALAAAEALGQPVKNADDRAPSQATLGSKVLVFWHEAGSMASICTGRAG